jgi:hypothetical protein
MKFQFVQINQIFVSNDDCKQVTFHRGPKI